MIEIKNLQFTYPTGTHALKGINLTINAGEVIAIIGQNGSGKTTLVRHLNGLLKPTSGEIFIEGRSVDNQSVGELSKTVGYVFQNPNHQIFCKTVKEELEVGPNNFGFTNQQRDENVKRAIELMELGDIMDEHPIMLDYTSKKILTIASVLTFSPKVFIMDEPTGGLDEAGRVLLRRIIKTLKAEGHTVIMISHDMDFVAETMERIVVMANGEIVQDTDAQNCFKDKEVMHTAWIEPPQITQLGYQLYGNDFTALSVNDFVEKYQQKNI